MMQCTIKSINNNEMAMKNLVFVAILLSFTKIALADTTMAPNTASTCVACHGPLGSSPNPLWPNIAGQHSSYLQKQLLDIKAAKTRIVPVMTAIVASLNPKDLEDLVLYYSGQTLTKGKVPKKYLKRGEQIYRGGDFEKGITACIACHSPSGKGNGQAGFPVLSGQNAQYTVQQLQSFKNHTRKNDMNSIMQDISKRMDDSDMEAVAYYVQGLH